MEDYLQYMRTLRTQINEVEDQATKLSAQEQMHITTIRNLEKDLDFVKSETKRVLEETERIMKEKGLICSQILEKHRKIASLEQDSFTLNQTLDLMQHERVSQSTKLVEKSSYYANVAKDITTELKEQQGWLNASNRNFLDTENGLVGKSITQETCETEASQGNIKSLLMKFDAAKAELDQMMKMKHNLLLENRKIKQTMELVNSKLNEYKPEHREMDIELLDEELQMLLSDKSCEAEYLQTLQLQIMALKEISNPIKCSCGEEYQVDLGACGEA